LTELFNAFPYADRDDEVKAGLGLSVALAGLIGAILRPSLPAAPLIGVTAPKAGTGKSYLVDLISMIAIGQRATCVVSGVTPEEFQKSLGASLLASAPLMSLDNMVQPLGGQLLCMVLTQERVDMRMLGFLRMGSLATATAMFATGNNLKIIGDLTRRTLLCQLDAREERPEERTFESDLLAEASRRRPELVSAVLTIARWGYLRREMHPSWSLADRGEGRPFAGFDAWCLRVRDPLLALGCKDPVGALDRVRAADPLGEQLRILINSWAIELGDQTVTCKEAVYKANCGGGALLDAMISCAGEQQGEVNKIRLGKFLAAHEGSIVEGMAFHRDEKCKNAVRWRLRPVQGS
jgi:putative DNA primase/helicase